MQQGTVVYYNVNKDMGFIRPDDDGKDFFFKSSGLIDKVHEKDRVQFEVIDGPQGPTAIKVKRI